MDEDWRRARREALWNSTVLVNAKNAGIDVALPRIEVAAKLLEFQRIEYLEACKLIDPDVIGSDEEAFLALARARLTWQLLNQEAYGWLVSASPGDELGDAEIWQEDAQRAAALSLGRHLAPGGAVHREAVDPVAVMLPRWLAKSISDGLEALHRGEVQPIFQPTTGGQHGQAFTWEKMRLRAVQHVAFFSGTGSTKKSARQRVELATKIKSDTLRDWEIDLKKKPLERFMIEWARRAGELSLVLEHTPDYAKSDGNSMDGDAYAVLLELKREPLGAFGLRYRAYDFDTRQR